MEQRSWQQGKARQKIKKTARMMMTKRRIRRSEATPTATTTTTQSDQKFVEWNANSSKLFRFNGLKASFFCCYFSWAVILYKVLSYCYVSFAPTRPTIGILLFSAFFCLKRTHIPVGLRINGIHCYQSIWCALFIHSLFSLCSLALPASPSLPFFCVLFYFYRPLCWFISD